MAHLGELRRDAVAYQVGLRRWLDADGSIEAEAAGIQLAETLIMWRNRLKPQKGG